MSRKNIIAPLIHEIRKLIHLAHSAVARSIDTAQVMTNFEIGRRIVEHEQKGEKRAEYGKQIIDELSRHLTKEFGKGFSSTSLKLMRQFYTLYRCKIGQTLSDESFGSNKSCFVSL